MKITKKEVKEGKLLAAMSYLMITGLIIMLTEKKNKFVRLHAMQGTALLIVFLLLRVLTALVPLWLLGLNFWINVLIGITVAYLSVKAAQGEQVKVPLIYELGDWLVKTFNL
ncbi:hypothetical protein GF352_03235 [archaeon]|nr:hypothetical protein [archaeon]